MCPTDEYTSNLQVERGRELSHRFFSLLYFWERFLLQIFKKFSSSVIQRHEMKNWVWQSRLYRPTHHLTRQYSRAVTGKHPFRRECAMRFSLSAIFSLQFSKSSAKRNGLPAFIHRCLALKNKMARVGRESSLANESREISVTQGSLLLMEEQRQL